MTDTLFRIAAVLSLTVAIAQLAAGHIGTAGVMLLVGLACYYGTLDSRMGVKGTPDRGASLPDHIDEPAHSWYHYNDDGRDW